MATDILVYNTTGLTATITMSSMVTGTAATNNCWQGNYLDFGATRADLWIAKIWATFTAAPATGGTIDLYMSWSSATATLDNFPGGCTGVDGNYPGPSAVPADGLRQLEFIGSLVACALGTAGMQEQDLPPFFAKKRYGVPVLALRTTQVLSSVSASSALTFLDIRTQSQ